MDSDNENLIIDKTIQMTVVMDENAVKGGGGEEKSNSTGNRSGGFLSKFFRKKNASAATADIKTSAVQDTVIPGAKEISNESDSQLQDVHDRYFFSPRPFASGGQGEVALASDLALGCHVAVKSLHKKLVDDPHARSAFFNEAKLMASLDHPAIIPVHGLFTDAENGMHLAMKMIGGCTLREYLDCIIHDYSSDGFDAATERKSLAARLEIMLRICDAVGYAHDREILHRDLKLENIIVGKYRQTYVTDWGIAMNVKDAVALDKVMGTPGFVAPEVILEKRSDKISDVYSLGALLFELVTLAPAFQAKDVAGVLSLVTSGQHAPVRHKFNCHIDEDLVRIIEKALAFHPADRYQSVNALASDLRRFIAHEEVSANPDNFPARICRWGVNHRRGMLMATMAALLLGIGTAAFSLYREFKAEEALNLKIKVVSAIYSETLQRAGKIENNIIEIEHTVRQLRMNMEFSSFKKGKTFSKENSLMVPMEFTRKTPDDKVAYFNFLGKTPDEKDMRHLNNTAEFMRHSYQECKCHQSGTKDIPVAQMIYFMLEDGTFACFPGNVGIPANYDPRRRPWYAMAVAGGDTPVWNRPYQDVAAEKEQITTCSLALRDPDGKVIGVAAVDFSLARLADYAVNGSGDAAVIREKILFNKRGEVICRMISPGHKEYNSFVDPNLIAEMQNRQFGTLEFTRNNKNMLLVFVTIRKLDVLYVEIFDMDDLLKAYPHNHKG